MSEELKAADCPLCQSNHIYAATVDNAPVELHATICSDCGLMLTRETEAEAITAWNTRVQPAVPDDVVERVARAIDASYENGGDCEDAALQALAAMQPQPSSYEDRLHDATVRMAKTMGCEFVKNERWPDVVKASQPSTDPVRDELLGLLERASEADSPNDDVRTAWWGARNAALARAKEGHRG